MTAVLFVSGCPGCVDGPVAGGDANNVGRSTDGGSTPSEGADPTPLVDDIESRTLVSGRSHTCAIHGGGAVRCWGAGGAYGELGHGVYENTATPVTVSLEGTIVSLASSANHTCAIRSDGAGFCWGQNFVGSLGVPAVNDSEATPVALPSERRWLTLTAAAAHTCGITSTGALYCWGSNSNGALGIGEEGHRDTPVRVGDDDDWVDVAAGSATCAVRTDGTLWCMGQIGGTPRLAPVLWDDGGAWTAIEAFDARFCGVRDGQLVCFTSDDAQMLPPVEGVTAVEALSVGGDHTCVVVDGDVVCGGANGYGQLGTEPQGSHAPYGPVVDGNDWVEVSTGAGFSCARRASGEISCWGRNSYGELGRGEMALSTTFRPVGTEADWIDVAAGAAVTCALRSNGAAFCFGSDEGGQLGDGIRSASLYNGAKGPLFVDEPVAVDTDEVLVDLEARSAKVAALYDDDGMQRVLEWGQIEGGVFSEDSPRPPSDFNTNSGWTALAVGFAHVCGVGADQGLYCYGSNNDSQLGTTSVITDTVQVSDAMDWTHVAVGDHNSCGIRAAGGLYCWGRGSELGLELDDDEVAVPQQVLPATVFTDVVSSSDHRCALAQGGAAWCWGQSAYAQLGAGRDQVASSLPVSVSGGHQFSSLAASRLLTCGITIGGALYCWGNLPIGPAEEDADDAYEPVQLGADTDWVQVTVGDQHVCAIKEAGTLHCLGDNRLGQLGDGNAYEPEPAPVAL